MKRLLTTSLILLAVGGFSVAYAQSNHSYQDDIYYNSNEQKKESSTQKNDQQESSQNQEVNVSTEDSKI